LQEEFRNGVLGIVLVESLKLGKREDSLDRQGCSRLKLLLVSGHMEVLPAHRTLRGRDTEKPR